MHLVNGKTMKIAFLIGLPDISGGSYAIYEHAVRMNRRGCSVSIITEDAVEPSRYLWHPEVSELEWATLNSSATVHFDVAIATWWGSIFLLERLSADHYVYFVQSIESRFFEQEDPEDYRLREWSIQKDLCESTYFYSIPVITEASWVQQYLEENYCSSVQLIRNGIRKDIYQEDGECIAPRSPGKLRVLVEGPVDVFYKNVKKTLELCMQSDADEVWLLTPSPIDSYPGVDHVFSQVPIHLTAPIYRSCDVLVKLSYVEGMFGPPLEMFHCGGTSIVYDVTGYDEYIRHDENAFVVEKDDDAQVVHYLNLLKHNPEILDRLKHGARNTADTWPDWEESSRLFENALLSIRSGPPISRTYLSRMTQHLFKANATSASNRELQRFTDREKYGDSNRELLHNFIQIYWHNGEGFSEETSISNHYLSGKWIVSSFYISASRSAPFFIRIDPSIRIGVVLIDYIRIMIDGKKSQSVEYSKSLGWKKVEVYGTARIISKNNILMLESFGNDPQLVVPELDNITEEDRISIEVKVKEIGFGQTLHELCPDLVRGSLRPWHRFFLKVLKPAR